MAYYKNSDEQVFWYDDEQMELGYGKDLTPITDQEAKVLTAYVPEANPKTDGEIYPGTDYKVPFTSEDANALMQVNTAFSMGVVNTNIKFSNGTVMPIQATEFQDFAIWFVNKRNGFFI